MAFHQFSVGKIRCSVVSDGGENKSTAEMVDLFPPQPEIKAAFAKLTEPIDFGQNCLLIESEGQFILIDTGEGTLKASHTPQLLHNLSSADISPEQIDIVVLTHGHSDHIGGVVGDEGKLIFPNARHLMTRLDWEHWTGPALRPASERCLLPLRDRITLIEPDAQIAPGVRAKSAIGHTPGNIGILVESDGEKLIDLVDIAHHPLQIAHSGWSPRFDEDPVQAAQIRQNLTEQAARENCLIMGYHFSYPGLGTVRPDGKTFRFVPLEE